MWTVKAATLDRDRLIEGREDPPGDRRDVLRRHVLKKDRELVATEPGGRIALANARQHPLTNLGENGIAGMVAMGIVDQFEVVEVDEEDGAAAVTASSAGQRVTEPVAEEAAGARHSPHSQARIADI